MCDMRYTQRNALILSFTSVEEITVIQQNHTMVDKAFSQAQGDAYLATELRYQLVLQGRIK